MYKFVETRAISTAATFIETLQSNRLKCAKSILEFPFNNKRLKVLSSAKTVPTGKNGIVYWMSRNQRVDDNWGLLYAQALGLK
jgi:deoxyribodipyrimidine photo-lyase